MHNKGILLVGGSGFLGSHIAKNLRQGGINVAVLDRNEPSAPDVESFVGDLRDITLLRTALSQYSRVIYLAHESHAAPSADNLPANFLSNLSLFLHVLTEARDSKISEFTLLSSGGAVYGEALCPLVSEEHPKNPRSPYGVAKITMESYLSMAASQDGFRHLIIRPSNPYGPGQNFRAAQGIVAVALAKIARNEQLVIQGDGSAIKDYVFIDDFSDAVSLLLTTSEATGAFNIGSGQGTTIIELLSAVSRLIGPPVKIDFQRPRANDVTANVLDCAKLRQATGWAPKVNMDEGLRRTWMWMKDQVFRRATE